MWPKSRQKLYLSLILWYITTPHVTQLLVDDCVLPTNSAILSMWSTKFDELREEDNDVYLEGFAGNAEQVKSCLQLLHGCDVPISIDNFQVILKFGLLNQIYDITSIAESWLKEHVGEDVTHQNKKLKPGKNPVSHSHRNFIKMLR